MQHCFRVVLGVQGSVTDSVFKQRTREQGGDFSIAVVFFRYWYVTVFLLVYFK